MQETTEYVFDMFSMCDVPLVLARTPKNVPCVKFRFHLYLHLFVQRFKCQHITRNVSFASAIELIKRKKRCFDDFSDVEMHSHMLHGAGIFTNIYPNKITQSGTRWYPPVMLVGL